MAKIILVGKEWKPRVLLRAQLIEEGLNVEAYELLDAALEASVGEGVRGEPSILIADLSASSNPDVEVPQLARWSKRIPIWVIASRSFVNEKELQAGGFEAIFFRPIDLGELVEQIKRRLGAARS